MWKGKGRSGYGESSTLGDYDDWSCLSRNGKQWKNPITMQTRDLSGADYWHMRKQLTDSYDVPEELHAVNETVSLAHTLPSGKANLAAYGDPVPVRKPVSKVSIKDKILPQFKRLQTLRTQMLDLEKEYKTTDMTCEEYSILRDVIVCKIERAEVLYKKAISVRPKRDETDEDSHQEDSAVFYTHNYSNPSDNTRTWGEASASWIDEISDRNSFKSFLKGACKVIRTGLHYKHKIGSYLQTLKEV